MTVRRTGLRVVIIAAVVLIVGIAAAALAMRNLWFGKTGGPVQAVNAPADVVARGKYLAEAADKKQTMTRTFLLFRELQSTRNPSSPLKPESPDGI